MLCVKTFLATSPLGGVGVFADEPINRGRVVCMIQSGFDHKFSREDILILPDPAMAHLYDHIWKSPDGNGYILDGDHGRYMNHHKNANIFLLDAPRGVFIACRTIHDGEEITSNYKEFDKLEGGDDSLWAEMRKKLGYKEPTFFEKLFT